MQSQSSSSKTTSPRVRARTSVRTKLKETTFCLNEKPIKSLLWCDKVPKGKRNKPAKINGIVHHEISDAVEHAYYMPIQ